MFVYNFINPSDAVTFKAENDKVAFSCVILIGAQFGAERFDKGKEISLPMLIFMSEKEMTEAANNYLECDCLKFIEENKSKIIQSLKSFAYGSIEERNTFDDALEAITDPEKLANFKKKHEDRNRTSMNQIVAHAWQLAEQLENGKEREGKCGE